MESSMADAKLTPEQIADACGWAELWATVPGQPDIQIVARALLSEHARAEALAVSREHWRVQCNGAEGDLAECRAALADMRRLLDETTPYLGALSEKVGKGESERVLSLCDRIYYALAPNAASAPSAGPLSGDTVGLGPGNREADPAAPEPAPESTK
jgi:hypothetical protein